MVNVSEIKSRGLKGSIWNFLNMMVNQLKTFIVSLILARLLMPADFGLVSMALILNSILDFLVDFGFSSAIIQKETIDNKEVSTVLWLNLLIGGCCSIIALCCAPLIAWFYEMSQLKSLINVTAWSFLISSFGTLQTALFQRALDFKSPFSAKLISGLVSGGIGIAMAFGGYGVWALVYSNVAGWVLYSVIIWIMSPWRPKFIFKLYLITDMISFGAKMTLSTVINRIVKQMDTLIIGKLYSAASLGLYNRAQSLNNLVIEYSFSSIRSVMLPSLSMIQKDNEAMKYSVLKLLHIISFLTFYFSGIMFICADDILLFLYGEQWVGAVPIFRILSISSISLCLPVIFDAVLTAVNRMTMYLWLSVFRNIILLLAIPLGVKFGFIVYVWAVSIASILKIFPSMVTTKIAIRLSLAEQLIAVGKYILPMGILLVFWYFVNFNTNIYILNIILKSLLYTIFFLVLNLVMGNEGIRIFISLLNGALKRLKSSF